eukprot:2801059-Amphidinium_carterae.1
MRGCATTTCPCHTAGSMPHSAGARALLLQDVHASALPTMLLKNTPRGLHELRFLVGKAHISPCARTCRSLSKRPLVRASSPCCRHRQLERLGNFARAQVSSTCDQWQ